MVRDGVSVKLRLRTGIDTCNDPLWEQLVNELDSDVFHAPAWHRVLRDTYGFTPEAAVLLDPGDRPAAGMSVCLIEDVRGRRIVSMPFSDYCDPLVEDDSQWQPVSSEFLRLSPVLKLRCRRSTAPVDDERFEKTGRARWHGVTILPTGEEAWQRVDGSARRAVTKAQRAGVTVTRVCDGQGVRAFYDLHLAVRKYKYGLLAQPFRFFESISANFLTRNQGVLLLAHFGERTIGGVLLLRWKDRLYYKFNASYAPGLEHRPNDLLMWSAIEYARETGCELLDLGLTDWDQEGLIRYKRKYADLEGEISFLERKGAPQAHHVAAGPLIGELSQLLAGPTVPDSVTEEGGNLLYRYFA